METYYQSPIGVLLIRGDEEGLAEISFAEENQLPDTITPDSLKKYIKQLDEYFNYKRNSFDINLILQGTDFQKIVWQKILKIPYGQTISYMDIALQVGGKDVIRAAASAIGKNKINIIVPCHRVIGTNGSLTGYSGGLKRKEWLLNFESKVKQGNLFYNTNYKLL